MQAVILAAGLGTRMGQLTKQKPKPLLTVQNKTLLEHNLRALPDEIDEVVLVVGYLANQIKQTIGGVWQPLTPSPLPGRERVAGGRVRGIKIKYVHQTELKGTAHALAVCKKVLRGPFLVLMGDDLYDKRDLEELVKHSLAVLVLELKQHDLKDARQAIVKTDQEGKVVNIIERQPAKKGSLVNCGAYVLDERYFKYPLVPAGNKTSEFGLPQTFLQMIREGTKMDIVKASWWHKVAGPEDLSAIPPLKIRGG